MEEYFNELNLKIETDEFIDNEKICEYIVINMVEKLFKFDDISNYLDQNFYQNNIDSIKKYMFYYILYLEDGIESNNIYNLNYNGRFIIYDLDKYPIIYKNLLLVRSKLVYKNVYLYNMLIYFINKNIENEDFKQFMIFIYKYTRKFNIRIYPIEVYRYFLNQNMELNEEELYYVFIHSNLDLIKKYNILEKIQINKKIFELIIQNNNYEVIEYLYEQGYNIEYDIYSAKCNYKTLTILNKYNNIITPELIIDGLNNEFISLNDLIKYKYSDINKIKHIKTDIKIKYLTIDIVNDFNILGIIVNKFTHLENKYNELEYIKNNKPEISICIHPDIMDKILSNNLTKYYKFINNEELIGYQTNLKNIYLMSLYIQENNIDCEYYSDYLVTEYDNLNYDQILFYYEEILKNVKFINKVKLNKTRDKLLIHILDKLNANYLYQINEN